MARVKAGVWSRRPVRGLIPVTQKAECQTRVRVLPETGHTQGTDELLP